MPRVRNNMCNRARLGARRASGEEDVRVNVEVQQATWNEGQGQGQGEGQDLRGSYNR